VADTFKCTVQKSVVIGLVKTTSGCCQYTSLAFANIFRCESWNCKSKLYLAHSVDHLFFWKKESASPVCVYSRRRSLIPVQGLTKKVGRRAYWPTGACLTRWPELIRARASGHVSGCHCPVSIQQLRNSRARTTTAKTSSQRFRPPTVSTQDARTHPHHL